MNASPAEYTLLIVESPTLAERLQAIAPQHIVVLATGGFLWEPRFSPENGTLNKRALPDKADLRKELRTEAKHAVKIIVATDQDPSGDFIAWTIFKEIPNSTIYRGNLRSVSRSALQNLLNEASQVDFSTLFHRLQNRYRIRKYWEQIYPGISIKYAGLLALFSGTTMATRFRSHEGDLLTSEKPIAVSFNTSEFKVARCAENGWSLSRPLSTFDAVEALYSSTNATSYLSAQKLLQTTFEAKNVVTGEGLISYPRTEYRSYFPDTWHALQQQWIKKNSVNNFLPAALQRVPKSEAAHDAIHPVNLNIPPQWVERHLPSGIAGVYRIIHSRTLESIKMPTKASSTFIHLESSCCLTSNSEIKSKYLKIKPVVTISELGLQLCKLGVLRPSGFGTFIDLAIQKEWIITDRNGDVQPGREIENHLEMGPNFSTILKNLQSVADNPDLNTETIRGILTS